MSMGKPPSQRQVGDHRAGKLRPSATEIVGGNARGDGAGGGVGEG